jgi:hypothetical protein
MVQSYGASKGLELPEFLDAEDTRRSWGRAESDGYFTDRVYLSSRKL